MRLRHDDQASRATGVPRGSILLGPRAELRAAEIVEELAEYAGIETPVRARHVLVRRGASTSTVPGYSPARGPTREA